MRVCCAGNRSLLVYDLSQLKWVGALYINWHFFDKIWVVLLSLFTDDLLSIFNLWMQLEIEWRVWKISRKLLRPWRWLQLQSCGQFKCVLKILVAFGNHLLHFLGILQVCLYTICFLLFIDTWAFFLLLFVGTYILHPPSMFDVYCERVRVWRQSTIHIYGLLSG